MSKRRHNFGTKRFKEKPLFIFHARIALKSLILLFVRLIARGARIGKTHRHTDTHRIRTVTLAHARRGLIYMYLYCMHVVSVPTSFNRVFHYDRITTNICMCQFVCNFVISIIHIFHNLIFTIVCFLANSTLLIATLFFRASGYWQNLQK